MSSQTPQLTLFEGLYERENLERKLNSKCIRVRERLLDLIAMYNKLYMENTNDSRYLDKINDTNDCVFYIEYVGKLKERNVTKELSCFSKLRERIREKLTSVKMILDSIVREHDLTDNQNVVIKNIYNKL